MHVCWCIWLVSFTYYDSSFIHEIEKMGEHEDAASSFGIKKIVDCKIAEGGRQMYKVCHYYRMGMLLPSLPWNRQPRLSSRVGR